MDIKIKLLNSFCEPKYKTKGASCADCYTNINKDVWVWLNPVLIPLGFALELPCNYEAQIRGRSGLSSKGFNVALGTIDSDYRDEVMACCWSLFPKKIKPYDRVCQLFIGKTNKVKLIPTYRLSETKRGDNGFGSTGVNR